MQDFCAKSQRLQKVLISKNLTLILWAWQGGVAKIKVAYNLVLLSPDGIPVMCMTCTYDAPFEAAEVADFPKLSTWRWHEPCGSP